MTDVLFESTNEPLCTGRSSFRIMIASGNALRLVSVESGCFTHRAASSSDGVTAGRKMRTFEPVFRGV